MSITASTWAWQQELPSSRKMVLLDLAERHNGQTGHCFPSIATIAQRTGLSLRCVQGHLRALAARIRRDPQDRCDQAARGRQIPRHPSLSPLPTSISGQIPQQEPTNPPPKRVARDECGIFGVDEI